MHLLFLWHVLPAASNWAGRFCFETIVSIFYTLRMWSKPSSMGGQLSILLGCLSLLCHSMKCLLHQAMAAQRFNAGTRYEKRHPYTTGCALALKIQCLQWEFRNVHIQTWCIRSQEESIKCLPHLISNRPSHMTTEQNLWQCHLWLYNGGGVHEESLEISRIFEW